jgi:hypothetical protein
LLRPSDWPSSRRFVEGLAMTDRRVTLFNLQASSKAIIKSEVKAEQPEPHSTERLLRGVLEALNEPILLTRGDGFLPPDELVTL